MKRMIGLSLCIVCIFTFSAYDWGRKSKNVAQESQKTAGEAEAMNAPAASQKNAWDTYALPSQVNKPIQYKDVVDPFTLVPIPLYHSLAFQLLYAHVDIQDPELKSALMGFFAKLAL